MFLGHHGEQPHILRQISPRLWHSIVLGSDSSKFFTMAGDDVVQDAQLGARRHRTALHKESY